MTRHLNFKVLPENWIARICVGFFKHVIFATDLWLSLVVTHILLHWEKKNWKGRADCPLSSWLCTPHFQIHHWRIQLKFRSEIIFYARHTAVMSFYPALKAGLSALLRFHFQMYNLEPHLFTQMTHTACARSDQYNNGTGWNINCPALVWIIKSERLSLFLPGSRLASPGVCVVIVR
jgi:hypothetical protein